MGEPIISATYGRQSSVGTGASITSSISATGASPNDRPPNIFDPLDPELDPPCDSDAPQSSVTRSSDVHDERHDIRLSFIARAIEEHDAARQNHHHGIHRWMVMLATEQGHGLAMQISLLLGSTLFLLFQILAAFVVLVEAVYLKCDSHSDCHLGMWCGPQNYEPFGVTPGECADCYLVLKLYEGTLWRAEMSSVPSDWKAAALAHCTATDQYPARCDFLVHRENKVTLGSGMLFVVVLLIVGQFILEDQAQALRTLMLAEHRVSSIRPNMSRRIVRSIIHTITSCRCLVLPCAICGGFASLVLSSVTSASSLLLNGVAIGVLAHLDDVVAYLVIPASHMGAIDRAMNEHRRAGRVTVHGSGVPWPVRAWLAHRVLGISFFVTLCAVTFRPEWFMSIFGNETMYGTVCSDIVEGMAYPILIVGSVSVLFEGFLIHATSWRSAGTAVLIGMGNVVLFVCVAMGGQRFAHMLLHTIA